jgi:hypothetical protein
LCEKKHVLTKQNEQALVLETGLTGLAAKKTKQINLCQRTI